MTRVSASPRAQSDTWTSGDKAALACDLLVDLPANCPPVSPACPPARDAQKLSLGAESPVSPTVPVEKAQVSASQCERADLAGDPPGAHVTVRIEQEAMQATMPNEEFVTDDALFGMWRDRLKVQVSQSAYLCFSSSCLSVALGYPLVVAGVLRSG